MSHLRALDFIQSRYMLSLTEAPFDVTDAHSQQFAFFPLHPILLWLLGHITDDVILWGAKGHAKVLAELFTHTGHRVVALFDNDPQAQSPLTGVPLGIGWDGFCEWNQRRPAGF